MLLTLIHCYTDLSFTLVQELRDRQKVQYLLKLTGPTGAKPTDDRQEAGAGPGGRAGKGKGEGGRDRLLRAEVCRSRYFY